MDVENEYVEIVAVDSGPVLYNIQCSICEDLISEDTENGDSLEPVVLAHRLLHNL